MNDITPGPWKLTPWGAGDSHGWTVKCDQHISIDAYSAESEANALAIAAVPEMIEALWDAWRALAPYLNQGNPMLDIQHRNAATLVRGALSLVHPGQFIDPVREMVPNEAQHRMERKIRGWPLVKNKPSECTNCQGHRGWLVGIYESGVAVGQDFEECDVCQGTGKEKP